MKASRLLNVVLAVALVVVSVRLAMGNAGAANRASSSGNDTADIVYQNIGAADKPCGEAVRTLTQNCC